MPENQTTTQDPNNQGQAGAAQAGGREMQSVYDEIAAKKGFKDRDSFAKSYSEIEKAHSGATTRLDKISKQLESVGYKINDDGSIIASDNNQGHQFNQPVQPYNPYPQGQVQQPQGEAVYDPYSLTPITDPVALQLARMPLGQREAFITNSILHQRDKLLSDSQDVEEEMMDAPEFKGFERDVKKIMRKLPLNQRVNKDAWKDALLRVKGAKFDMALKQHKEGAVDEFLNADNAQGFGGAIGAGPGQGGSLKASPEEMSIWNTYKSMKDNPFKDLNEFLQYQRSSSPSRA